MLLPPAIEDRIQAIRSDRVRGAAELAQAAAEALLAVLETAPERLAEAARQVMEAQPTMAPLVNLSRTAVSAADPRAAVLAFLQSLGESASRVAAHAAALVPDGGAALTHSSSAAVYETLRLAWKQGKRFRVFATESRPLREGAALARRLGGDGVPVVLIADAALASALSECSVALVGADAVSSRGVVNKIGTLPLALAASALRIPLYALCGSEKFLPEDYQLPPEPPKDPRELLALSAPNVSVRNFYFEFTPLDLFAGLVREDGIRTTASHAARPATPR